MIYLMMYLLVYLLIILLVNSKLILEVVKMNFIKELTNKTVSISDFNRGLAGKIFEDVKTNGLKIVLKNNSPQCVLISPNDYNKLIEELENAKDLALAEERLSSCKKEELISKNEFEKMFKLDFDQIDSLDEDEIE